MMTRLAPYAVPAVCAGAIFAWEERAVRQNCEIQGKSLQMCGVMIRLVTSCLEVLRVGYVATSAPMAAVLVVAPYLGTKVARVLGPFVMKKVKEQYPEFIQSKKFTIIALSGISLTTFASYALYAPSMHWGKQAGVIAICNLAFNVLYRLYSSSLGPDERQAIGKGSSWGALIFPLGIGVTVAWKNDMLTFLVLTHFVMLIEQVAIRRFASSEQADQPRNA